MNSVLNQIATLLKALEETYQKAHNATTGEAFHSDHEFFDASHTEAHDRYDKVIEAMKANKEDVDTATILSDAAGMVAVTDKDSPEAFYNALLTTEQALRDLIDASTADLDEADVQLVGDIAKESKNRTYKMSQRVTAHGFEFVTHDVVRAAGNSESNKRGWETRRAHGFTAKADDKSQHATTKTEHEEAALAHGRAATQSRGG